MRFKIEIHVHTPKKGRCARWTVKVASQVKNSTELGELANSTNFNFKCTVAANFFAVSQPTASHSTYSHHLPVLLPTSMPFFFHLLSSIFFYLKKAAMQRITSSHSFEYILEYSAYCVTEASWRSFDCLRFGGAISMHMQIRDLQVLDCSFSASRKKNEVKYKIT